MFCSSHALRSATATLLRTGGLGAVLFSAGAPSSRCEESLPKGADRPPSPLMQPTISKRGDGSGVAMNPVVIAISCAAGVVIPTILFLALRSARRAERMEDFVRAIELFINKSPAVKTAIGPVYAAGDYQLAVTSTTGSGMLSVCAPGQVRGVAVLEARRPGSRDKWEFPAMRLEFDKAALDARAAERQARILARYGAAAVEAGAAAAAAAAASAKAAAAVASPPAIDEAKAADIAAGATVPSAATVPALPASDVDPDAPEVLVITLA